MLDRPERGGPLMRKVGVEARSAPIAVSSLPPNYSQLGEGLLEYVGPLVETGVQEKPLSIALREINAGLLTHEQVADPAQ